VGFFICIYLYDMKFIITEEQSEKLNQKVKSMVNKYGFKETLRLFDNNKDIIRRAYQDNPSEYLNQFNDLTPVEKDNKIYYVDKDRLPLFYYYQDEENGDVHIDYDRIWSFFQDVISLDYEKIQGVMENWLEETYNLRGLTPYLIFQKKNN
jgi:hypothetical protein